LGYDDLRKDNFSGLDTFAPPQSMDVNHSASEGSSCQGQPDSWAGLSEADRKALQESASEAIRQGLRRHGLIKRKPFAVDPCRFSLTLQQPGAAFVTLRLDGRLRGCIGSLIPRRALVEDVAHNARAAAFHDRRFAPLTTSEFPRLDVHISVLTPLTPMGVGSREELLSALRPGKDGLLLEDPPHRSTFLPQVWESLPDPEDFLGELFLKAGLPRGHWSPTLTVQRYSVEEF
jgi:AmmeMemoRadiSam system protein A